MTYGNILATAYEEVGYTETADNLTKFGKWYGLDGNPWCAMFVSWVYNKVGEGKKVAASTKNGFASCSAGLAWFAKKNKLVPVGDAQEGDIVFFQFDDDAQPDHVGLVAKNLKKRKILVCVEGNTSPDKKGSQSNGGGVYEKKRSYATVMAVARP
jgi:cell wall-associated NlpC family hydrolase